MVEGKGVESENEFEQTLESDDVKQQRGKGGRRS